MQIFITGMLEGAENSLYSLVHFFVNFFSTDSEICPKFWSAIFDQIFAYLVSQREKIKLASDVWIWSKLFERKHLNQPMAFKHTNLCVHAIGW